MKEPNEQELTPARPAHEEATEAAATGTRGAELAQVLDGYLAELEAGRSPDRARLLAAHPDLAPQLEPALAGLEFIHQATGRTAEAPPQLGDFRIVREVGRGGMGVVYEAEQVSLKRRVALKVLRFGAVADEVAMQRFQREAETVARLHHTNIVPIFAVGSAEGVRYYAMQFIEGRDLAERLRVARDTGQTIAERDIADWGLQAATHRNLLFAFFVWWEHAQTGGANQGEIGRNRARKGLLPPLAAARAGAEGGGGLCRRWGGLQWGLEGWGDAGRRHTGTLSGPLAATLGAVPPLRP